ncbi:MAG: hypothetical protein VZR00_05735 [Lachnospiraceae bacterium]|nr:hypothetical protein [Lachnospiraceae bacterium]MEE3461379.1 hypothetical protein [Lachnospiraceae bacterium]
MYSKKTTIIGAILLLVGFIIVGIGAVMGGGVAEMTKDFQPANKTADMADITPDSDTSAVKKLNIRTIGGSVQIRTTGEKLEVGGEAPIDKFIKGDTLYVGGADGIKYTYASATGNITLNSDIVTSGKSIVISLPEGMSFDEVSITSKGTKIDIDSLTCSTLNVNSSLGHVKLVNSTVSTKNIKAALCNVSINGEKQ